MSLRAAVDDESERSSNWAAQFKHDLANVQLALQVIRLSYTLIQNTLLDDTVLHSEQYSFWKEEEFLIDSLRLFGNVLLFGMFFLFLLKVSIFFDAYLLHTACILLSL